MPKRAHLGWFSQGLAGRQRELICVAEAVTRVHAPVHVLNLLADDDGFGEREQSRGRIASCMSAVPALRYPG